MKNLENIIKLKNVLNHKFGMMPYMEDEADDEMDGGCPEGYVQDGMKMVDGKEVPNCVPKKEQEEKDEMPEEFKYDWDQCVADQMERYGDEETAKKVCGAIKAGMRKDFKEGDDLSNACWPGYHAEGLKEMNGKMVPNCVPDEKKS